MLNLFVATIVAPSHHSTSTWNTKERKDITELTLVVLPILPKPLRFSASLQKEALGKRKQLRLNHYSEAEDQRCFSVSRIREFRSCTEYSLQDLKASNSERGREGGGRREGGREGGRGKEGGREGGKEGRRGKEGGREGGRLTCGHHVSPSPHHLPTE